VRHDALRRRALEARKAARLAPDRVWRAVRVPLDRDEREGEALRDGSVAIAE
jgi:hypothetical protein